MNNSEKKAIRNLEKAFKRCAELGIEFAGMDDDLLFATKDCLSNVTERCSYDYCTVAIANQCGIDGSGHLNTFGAYQDSGGY